MQLPCCRRRSARDPDMFDDVRKQARYRQNAAKLQHYLSRDISSSDEEEKDAPFRPDRPAASPDRLFGRQRSEEHTSELQSLMRISYAVFCLKTKTYINNTQHRIPK